MTRTPFLLSLFAALTPSLPPDNAVVNIPTAVFAKLRLMPLLLLALLLSVQLGAASDRLQSSVLAFWPMDDPMYAQATLSDAGPNQFDLTLWEGELATGRFGGALLVRAERDHPVYYAGYPGSYFDRMRMPDGQPTGLWGPTLPPTALLERLAEGSWSLEFWIRIDKVPTAPFTILDLGDALAPGFALSADPLSGVIRLANHYAGFEARIRTDVAALPDGRWHHLSLSFPAGAQAKPALHVDGRLQAKAVVQSIARQLLPPPAVWPEDLSRPDPILCQGFTKENDQAWRQNHRFNLSLGKARNNTEGFTGALDEIRITREARLATDFVPPDSYTRNYGTNPSPPALPTGPPPLFANTTAGSSVDLGSRRHLFIDQALLEQSENLNLTCHPPRDRQAAAVEFEPEDSDLRSGVLEVDGRVWMMIPEGYNSKRGRVRVRVSDDGLCFRKPEAALTGGRPLPDGDAVLTHSPLYGNVFEDINPATAPGERYKLAAYLANRGIYIYTSPDAVNWRRNESCMLPLCSGGEAETYWDDQRGRYVSVLKRDSSCCHPESPEGHGGRRGIQFYTREILKPWPFRALTKPYFELWPFPAVTGEGDLIFDSNHNGEVYRTRVLKYPWAPDVYLAFVWRFAKDSETRRIDLGVSRDGENWTFFADHTWYMKPGQGEDEVLSIHGLIRRGEEIWQYFDFGGAHGGGERRYARFRQRLDGFVSLDAPPDGGHFVTRPLRFAGDRLALNIATGASGSARVALLDMDGRALKGYSLEECNEIKVDAINHIVSWRGSNKLTTLAGQTIRVRIEMRDSQLYAMQFGPEVSAANGAALKVWTAPAAQKVFREDDRPDDSAAAIIQEAAGNETESAQEVLRAAGQNDLLASATLAEFTGSGGSAPALRTHLMQVEYVYLSDLNRAWPEPLVRFRHPERKPIQSLRVNGVEYKNFDSVNCDVDLSGRTGALTIAAIYSK